MDNSSKSDEMTNLYFMTKHKKKNVSHSKFEPIYDMSYSELQTVFENLYGEAVDTFKMNLNKIVFSYLEGKVLETEKQMEALKKVMLVASTVDVEEDNCSWFGCETCYIWKKEVNILKAKLNKDLEPKVTFINNLSRGVRRLDNP